MNYLPLKLESFAHDKEFSLVIQYGFHDTDMFIHNHEDFDELTIVLSGNATHVVNQERYAIRKGDVFVIGRNMVHGFEHPTNFKICNIMYKPDIITNTSRDIKESAGFHALFALKPYLNNDTHFTSKLQLPPNIFESVNDIIANLVQEYQRSDIGRTTMVFSLFWSLVVTLSRAYHLEDIPKNSLLNLAVPLAYMNKNYRESITVEELAAQANMSSRNFSRVFHKAYGLSPINYVIQLRIQHAYELLCHSELSITEVGYLCGFQDSNYFTRQFKSVSGFTPREYRNMTLFI